jgi:hypothetical protein
MVLFHQRDMERRLLQCSGPYEGAWPGHADSYENATYAGTADRMSAPPLTRHGLSHGGAGQQISSALSKSSFDLSGESSVLGPVGFVCEEICDGRPCHVGQVTQGSDADVLRGLSLGEAAYAGALSADRKVCFIPGPALCKP